MELQLKYMKLDVMIYITSSSLFCLKYIGGKTTGIFDILYLNACGFII